MTFPCRLLFVSLQLIDHDSQGHGLPFISNCLLGISIYLFIAVHWSDVQVVSFSLYHLLYIIPPLELSLTQVCPMIKTNTIFLGRPIPKWETNCVVVFQLDGVLSGSESSALSVVVGMFTLLSSYCESVFDWGLIICKLCLFIYAVPSHIIGLRWNMYPWTYLHHKRNKIKNKVHRMYPNLTPK